MCLALTPGRPSSGLANMASANENGPSCKRVSDFKTGCYSKEYSICFREACPLKGACLSFFVLAAQKLATSTSEVLMAATLLYMGGNPQGNCGLFRKKQR